MSRKIVTFVYICDITSKINVTNFINIIELDYGKIYRKALYLMVKNHGFYQYQYQWSISLINSKTCQLICQGTAGQILPSRSWRRSHQNEHTQNASKWAAIVDYGMIMYIYYIILYHIILYHIISYYIISYYIILYYIILYHII